MFIRNDKFKKTVETLAIIFEFVGLLFHNDIFCYIAIALNFILAIL